MCCGPRVLDALHGTAGFMIETITTCNRPENESLVPSRLAALMSLQLGCLSDFGAKWDSANLPHPKIWSKSGGFGPGLEGVQENLLTTPCENICIFSVALDGVD